MLGANLHFLKLAQGAQAHIEDRIGLHLGEVEGLHQLGLWLILKTDDADDFIEIEIGDQIAIEHFEAMLDLSQAIAASGAARRPGGDPATGAARHAGSTRAAPLDH